LTLKMKATVNIITWKPDQFDFGYVDETGNAVLLNWNLAREKNLTWPQMQVIMQLHKERVEILKKMQRKVRRKSKVERPVRKSRCHNTLISLAVRMEQIEYQLQEAWGFEKDRTLHTWWYKVPSCKCGLTLPLKRIISSLCPIHGSEEWQFIEKLSAD